MFKFKKLIAVLIGILMIFSLAACNSSKNESNTNKSNKNQVEEKASTENNKEADKPLYPLTLVDSNGKEVTIEKEPAKVISVAPSITETIFALGKDSKLVGRTDYCDFPAEASKIDAIGSLMKPNIEKITELNPDVVIAASHFSEEAYGKLNSLGIKVVVLNEAKSFEGTFATIEKVGKILNAEKESEKIVKDMQNKIDSVKAKVKDAEKKSVYYVVGFGEYGDFTATGDTFIGELIEMAGAVNAASDSKDWKYNIEKLVEKDPELLICSKYFDAKKGIEAANGYKDLTSVKEGKLLEIDNNLIDRQGPRLADGFEELAKTIHPELFK